MNKYLSASLALASMLAFPAVSFAAPAPTTHASTQVTLSATITKVKGSVITIKASNGATYTMKLGAKPSIAGAGGVMATKKDLKVGVSVRAMGTLKGNIFTTSRMRIIPPATK
jgi:hypothetical protein